jgi:hypothetical protein
MILPTIHIHPKIIRKISNKGKIIRIPQARIIRLLPHLILKMLVITNKIIIFFTFFISIRFYIFLFYYIYVYCFFFYFYYVFIFFYFILYISYFLFYTFLYIFIFIFLFFILFYVWFLFIYFFSFVLINTLILSKFNQFELVRISLVLWISQHLILIFYHMKIFTFIKFYAIFSNYSKII